MIYPLLAWQVTVPTFTIGVTANAVTETLTVPGGVYWGWRTTGAEVGPQQYAPASGSLAKVLIDVLNTHTEIGAGTARYTGIGGIDTPIIGGTPGAVSATGIIVADVPSGTSVDATSNTAALAMFGLQAGDIIDGEATIARRTAGVWRPAVDGTRCEPVYQAGGTGAWSPYDPASHDRVRTGDRLVWTVTWPYVEASDITREVNGLADYLPLANRAPGDTNGTLDDVLYAASTDLELLLALPPIGTAAIDYRACILPVQADLTRDTYTTEESVGARRYRVVMALLQAGSYGGV